jgi:hypothetical protein
MLQPELPSLPYFESEDFELRFGITLSQCHQRFDFTDPDANLAGKANKSEDLMHILKLVESPGRAKQFPATIIQSLLDMIRANVYRPLIQIHRQMVITDDILPFADAEWEHLKIVYQILVRFQEAVPRCPLIDLSFMKTILKQIGSPDDREHSGIVQIVMHYAVQARQSGMVPLFEALIQELYSWEVSPNYIFAVTVVLEIVTCFLKEFPGFLNCARPLIDHCLPLLTAPSFLFFRTSYFNFLTTIHATEQPFAMQVVTIAVRYWPYHASSKQSLFLKILSIALPRLSLRQMGPVGPKVLSVISGAIQAESSRVAEDALTLLMERNLETFIVSNIHVIFPAVHGAIRNAAVNHWSLEIRDLAKKTLNTLLRLAPRLFQDLWRREGSQPDPEMWKLQSWLQIAEAASPSGASTKLNIAEISQTFGAGHTTAQFDPRKGRRGSIEPRILARSKMSLLHEPEVLFARTNDGAFGGSQEDSIGG